MAEALRSATNDRCRYQNSCDNGGSAAIAGLKLPVYPVFWRDSSDIGLRREWKIVVRNRIVIAAAWLEIVVGAIFIVLPDLPCILLFDAKPEAMGRPLARWIGISLFALGIACLPLKRMQPHRSAELGLFVFNAGLAVMLACYGAIASVHGFLLWPIVILHAVIAAMLLPLMFSPKGQWYAAALLDEATTRRGK